MIEFDEAAVGGSTGVLRSVTMQIAPGVLHLVLGGTAEARSALVALAHGGLAADGGDVRHFGATIRRGDRRARAALRRRLGVVERRARFVGGLDLARNLALPLAAAGRPVAGRDGDIPALLAWAGLAGRGGARPDELTAGERQRAAVARAVILDPEAVVADDPAQGLEQEEAERLMALFVDLVGLGRTLLLAMAEPDLAGWTVDRLPAEAAVRVFRLEAGVLEAAA